jgi:hypothetical protein
MTRRPESGFQRSRASAMSERFTFANKPSKSCCKPVGREAHLGRNATPKPIGTRISNRVCEDFSRVNRSVYQANVHENLANEFKRAYSALLNEQYAILSNRCYRTHFEGNYKCTIEDRVDQSDGSNPDLRKREIDLSASRSYTVDTCRSRWTVRCIKGSDAQVTTRLKHLDSDLIVELTQGSRGWFKFSLPSQSHHSLVCYRTGDVDKLSSPTPHRTGNVRENSFLSPVSSAPDVALQASEPRAQQDRIDTNSTRKLCLVNPKLRSSTLSGYEIWGETKEVRDGSWRVASVSSAAEYVVGGWGFQESGCGGTLRVRACDAKAAPRLGAGPRPTGSTLRFPRPQTSPAEHVALWLTRRGFVVLGTVRGVVCEDGAWCHVDRDVAAGLLALQHATMDQPCLP